MEVVGSMQSKNQNSEMGNHVKYIVKPRLNTTVIVQNSMFLVRRLTKQDTSSNSELIKKSNVLTRGWFSSANSIQMYQIKTTPNQFILPCDYFIALFLFSPKSALSCSNSRNTFREQHLRKKL